MGSKLILIVLVLCCCGATYYVDNGGNDSADGSSGTPWLTVSNGLRNIGAGVTLKLTSGQVFTETNLWCNKHGSAASPALITTTGAAKAVIAATNGCGLTFTNSSWLTVDNLEIIGNSTNRGDIDETPGPLNAAGVLYVIGNGSGSTNFTVRNCNIHLFGVGTHVWAQNTSTNLNALITSNFIYDCTYVGCIFKQNQNAGWITNPVCSYNTISNITGDAGGGGGIFFRRVCAPVASSNLVTYIHDGATYPSVGIEMDYSTNGVVRGNEISEVRRTGSSPGDSIGIDFDMGSDHELAELNYIHNCDGAGIQAFLSRTNITLRFNVVNACGNNSGSTGCVFILNSGSTTVGVDIYNNTLISPFAGVSGIVLGEQTQMKAGNTNVWANNIIVTSNGPAIYTYATTVTNIGLVDNCYYDIAAAPSFYWNGTTYSTWSTFTNAYKQDLALGKTNNPALKSMAVVTNQNALTIQAIQNYKVATGNALVGAGLDLSATFGWTLPATDFNGSPLGATYSVGACDVPWVMPMVNANKLQIGAGGLRFQ